MMPAITLSLQLASFDQLTTPGTVSVSNMPGLRFFNIGADTRAAVTAPGSQEAFRFLLLGIHEDETSAATLLDHTLSVAPWLSRATERWTALLQPFHHKGEANYLSTTPGRLFDTLCDSPGVNAPIVVLTSAGWVTGDTLNMDRVKAFSEGVLGVRASMTGIAGLHSQQSFFFPGVLTHDPMTVTIWKDAASIGKFAYGAGSHKMQMDKHKAQDLADRTSFTRCRIIRSAGTWYGVDPAGV